MEIIFNDIMNDGYSSVKISLDEDLDLVIEDMESGNVTVVDRTKMIEAIEFLRKMAQC